MDLLTIGDFYRKRFGKPVEIVTSLAITASYLGWTSAQITALGLTFSVLSGGTMSLETGIYLGAAFVLAYTIWGGMWSVALTDLFQSVIILVGLALVAWLVGDMAGGAGKVIAAASEAGKFDFFPKGGAKEWLAFLAAWMTLAIGSIPQQDVFQRVTSAKDEKTCDPRLSHRRRGVFLLRVRADLHCVCRAHDRSGLREALRGRGRSRDPAHSPEPDPRAHAAVGAGAVFRRTAVRDPVDGVRSAACTHVAFYRERDPAVRGPHERPAVHAAAARDAGELFACGASSSRSIRRARCTRWCRTPTR
jgi:hypothetical protein